MIHLDTSFLIGALARASAEDRELRGWLAAGEALRMSVIGWTEFLCRPVRAEDVILAARIVREPVTFTGPDAALTARFFNQSGRRRGSLIDCMIAATAVRAGAPLATSNPEDFRRLEPAGLRLVTA